MWAIRVSLVSVLMSIYCIVSQAKMFKNRKHSIETNPGPVRTMPALFSERDFYRDIDDLFPQELHNDQIKKESDYSLEMLKLGSPTRGECLAYSDAAQRYISFASSPPPSRILLTKNVCDELFNLEEFSTKVREDDIFEENKLPTESTSEMCEKCCTQIQVRGPDNERIKLLDLPYIRYIHGTKIFGNTKSEPEETGRETKLFDALCGKRDEEFKRQEKSTLVVTTPPSGDSTDPLATYNELNRLLFNLPLVGTSSVSVEDILDAGSPTYEQCLSLQKAIYKSRDWSKTFQVHRDVLSKTTCDGFYDKKKIPEHVPKEREKCYFCCGIFDGPENSRRWRFREPVSLSDGIAAEMAQSNYSPSSKAVKRERMNQIDIRRAQVAHASLQVRKKYIYVPDAVETFREASVIEGVQDTSDYFCGDAEGRTEAMKKKKDILKTVSEAIGLDTGER